MVTKNVEHFIITNVRVFRATEREWAGLWFISRLYGKCWIPRNFPFFIRCTRNRPRIIIMEKWYITFLRRQHAANRRSRIWICVVCSNFAMSSADLILSKTGNIPQCIGTDIRWFAQKSLISCGLLRSCIRSDWEMNLHQIFIVFAVCFRWANVRCNHLVRLLMIDYGEHKSGILTKSLRNTLACILVLCSHKHANICRCMFVQCKHPNMRFAGHWRLHCS